jgi:hypothetical protein
MRKKLHALAGASVLGAMLLAAPVANAQVEPGGWISSTPSYNLQQVGCGTASGLTFKLTCSSSSGEQRAERRYVDYTGSHQFEGSFKINSMGGSRVSVKQTFDDSAPGPYFLLAVEQGGRMYSVEGGATIATGATVGTTVKVDTVNVPGSTHRTYINGIAWLRTSPPVLSAGMHLRPP